MPNPRFRHTPSRRDKRRANWKLNSPNITLCPKCGSVKLPHRVCLECGYYGESLVYLKKEKKEKKKGEE